jgi:hypothetical protein
MDIVRCISCDGYGWFEDDETFEAIDCTWCAGIGYVYRDADGVDHQIPQADYGKVSAKLERLEQDRMRDLGYTGTARHPDDQPIRQRDDDE